MEQENLEDPSLLRIKNIEQKVRTRLSRPEAELGLGKMLPMIIMHLEDVISSGESPGKKRIWVDFQEISLEEIAAEFDVLRDVILEDYYPLSAEEKSKVIETILYYMGLTAWEYSKQRNQKLKNIETHLKEEIDLEKKGKKWFESILDSLPVGTLIVERTTGNILFANKYANSMAGGLYPIDIPLDENTEYYCTDADGRRLSRNELPRFRVARGERFCGEEFTGHYPGGQTTVILHSGIIAATDSQPEKVVLVFLEVGDRRRWENVKEKEVKDLKEERSLRESFVSSLTHDLRTPLSVARMHSEMLSRKLKDKELDRVHNIIRHIDDADRMIQDLLDANKIKAGQEIPIEPCESCLNDIVNQAVSDYRDLYGDRFFVEAGQDIRGFWCGKALRRILDNLLSNAVKYGNPKGPIKISFFQEGDVTQLSIHNMGPGIPPEEKKKLFEPFHRLSGVKGKEGWGIGLSLVKGLVEAHKGSIAVKSSDKEGTTFTITLPNRAPETFH